MSRTVSESINMAQPKRRNKILIYQQEPLDLGEARKRLKGILHYIDGITDKEIVPGFVYRKDPNTGDFGRINLEDACTEAALRTLMYGEFFADSSADQIYRFLNPSSLGLAETPYSEKLTVIPRIIEEYISTFRGGHLPIEFAGSIFNLHPTLIDSRFTDTTPFFWLRKGGALDRFEVLMNTKEENNTLLIKNSKFQIERLKEMHSKKNIFTNGPIDTVVPIGHRWHLPIIGITQIKYLDVEKEKIVIETTLDSRGTNYRDFDISPEEFYNKRSFLKPEGYL